MYDCHNITLSLCMNSIFEHVNASSKCVIYVIPERRVLRGGLGVRVHGESGGAHPPVALAPAPLVPARGRHEDALVDKVVDVGLGEVSDLLALGTHLRS